MTATATTTATATASVTVPVVRTVCAVRRVAVTVPTYCYCHMIALCPQQLVAILVLLQATPVDIHPHPFIHELRLASMPYPRHFMRDMYPARFWQNPRNRRDSQSTASQDKPPPAEQPSPRGGSPGAMPHEDMGIDAQGFLYQSGFQSGQASSGRATDQGKPPPTELSEGDVVEVFRNSARDWVPGRVAEVSPDFVRVEWTIDGRRHAKKLSRQSKDIRRHREMRSRLEMPMEPRSAEDDVLREDGRCQHGGSKQEAKKDPETVEEDVPISVRMGRMKMDGEGV